MNVPLVLAAAYLLGAIPFGYLLVKLTTGQDIRTKGSGNIGATNVLRTTNRGLGVLTLLLDAAKAFAAVWIADRATAGTPLWMSLAALFALLGHAFPVFLRFRGGKAVASLLGAFLYLAPVAVAGALVVFLVVAWRTRYISLGSISAAASLPLAIWFLTRAPVEIMLASIPAAALIVWRHRENIARLRAGKEHAFSLGGRRS